MIFNHFMKLFFTILYISYVKSNILYDVINKFDKIEPCEEYCQQSEEVSQCNSCCSRGCRFFSLIYMVEHADTNSTRESCDSSCLESYPETKIRDACQLGCSFMADQHKNYVLDSKISLSLYLDEVGVAQDLLIFQPQEIDPDYVLNDPGLRRQFLMTADDGLTIPQSRINTLPYERIPNTDEMDLKAIGSGGGWLDCVARRSGMPRLALTSVFLLVIILSLFLCIAPADPKTPIPPPPYTPLPLPSKA